MSANGQEIGVTMPGLGTRLDKFAEFAALAEDAGFDAVWDYEFWRNPFTIHMTTAASSMMAPSTTGFSSVNRKPAKTLSSVTGCCSSRSREGSAAR